MCVLANQQCLLHLNCAVHQAYRPLCLHTYTCHTHVTCMSYAAGLLELYQVTGQIKWLDWCQKLQATLDELFWDEASGTCFIRVTVHHVQHLHEGQVPAC